MIDPRELRLGNCVIDDFTNQCGKIVGINTNNESIKIDVYGCGYEVPYHQISPVRLSEEILLKCGFKKEIIPTSFGVHNIYYDKIITIHEIETFEWRMCEESDEYIIIVELKSIHQLMNLYFEISGKELEVKL